jgi:hypothetical protein
VIASSLIDGPGRHRVVKAAAEAQPLVESWALAMVAIAAVALAVVLAAIVVRDTRALARAGRRNAAHMRRYKLLLAMAVAAEWRADTAEVERELDRILDGEVRP